MVDADFFVTGHQPCDLGFRQANHRQIIIDGTNPYPAYCLFPTTSPTTIDALMKCVHIIDVAKPVVCSLAPGDTIERAGHRESTPSRASPPGRLPAKADSPRP